MFYLFVKYNVVFLAVCRRRRAEVPIPASPRRPLHPAPCGGQTLATHCSRSLCLSLTGPLCKLAYSIGAAYLSPPVFPKGPPAILELARRAIFSPVRLVHYPASCVRIGLLLHTYKLFVL